MKAWKVGAAGLASIGLAAAVGLRTVKIDPHLYLNVGQRFRDSWPRLSAGILKRGLEANTLEVLDEMHPDMSEKALRHRQATEEAWLRGELAWILHRAGDNEGALEQATRSIELKRQSTGPDAEDHFRLGVIQIAVGSREVGLHNALKGLTMDTRLDDVDDLHREATAQLLRSAFGDDEDPRALLLRLREESAEPLPDLGLETVDGFPFNSAGLAGKQVVILFFSPACGSCRMELIDLKELYATCSDRSDIAFLFVLNQPDRREDAEALLSEHGYEGPTLVVTNGNAYDWIPSEPTTWVVSESGKVIARSSGYFPGDIERLERLLSVSPSG